MAFATQPVVTVQDAGGNTVTSGADSTASVTLTLTAGTGSLTGTATMNAVAGVANFMGKGLKINLVGTDKVLTATATLTGPGVVTTTTSPAFTITFAAAAKLVVTTQPSASTVAGVAFAAQPVVQIQDAFGNVVTTGTDSSRVVTAALTTGSGTLTGTLTKTAAGGIADFSGNGLKIDLVGTDKVLTFTTTGGVITSTNTSPAFTITFAAAAKLVVTTQPSASTVAGVAFAAQPVVQIQDAFGNVVTTGTDSSRVVTAALTTGSGTLTGTLTKTAAGGIADFSGNGLKIDLVGTDKVLTFTTTGGVITSTNTSPAFTITFAAHSAFRITPSGSPTAGTAYALTITAVDQFSNTVTSVTGDHSFTFSGLTTADDGTHPTITDKNNAPVNVASATAITFTSGVSSAGGSLKAYKAESATLTGSDATSGFSTAGAGGTGANLTIANVSPVATTHSFTRGTNTSLKILKADLVAGATDANHDNVSVSSVQSPSDGGATVSAPAGVYVFYLPGAVVNGDTFTYTVSDGHGGTDTKTVTINVVNPGGIAQEISFVSGSVTVRFAGIPGISYDVQRSATSDFASFTTPLTTNAPSAGVFIYTDSSPLNPSGFYRLRQH